MPLHHPLHREGQASRITTRGSIVPTKMSVNECLYSVMDTLVLYDRHPVHSKRVYLLD